MGETEAMIRKKLQKRRYIAAFAITTLIFIIGILLGSYFSSNKLAQVYDLQKNLEMKTLGLDIQQALLSEEVCSSINSSSLTLEMTKVGQKLTYMEAQIGQKDPAVKAQKEYYHLLEIRHFLLVKKALEKCNTKFNYVLYFYADNDLCKSCEDQGLVLTYAHRRFPVFNTYSFDVNIDNPAVSALREIYNITTVPTVVVNKNKYVGFKEREDVLAILVMNGIITQDELSKS
jgi:hypothetical protein